MLETDPVDIALDADGDLDITTDIRLTSGLEAVQQGVQIVLMTAQEEVFTDLNDGTPWFQEIIGQPFDEARIRAIFRARLLTVPGVTSINSITLEFDSATRDLRVGISTKTVWGTDADATLARVI